MSPAVPEDGDQPMVDTSEHETFEAGDTDKKEKEFSFPHTHHVRIVR